TNWLYKLKANVSDSISALKNEITIANSSINSQNQTIDSLKLAINSSKETINSLNTKIQSISLLGLQFNKGTFKTIVFSFIAILAVLLLFFITKFKQSNNITVQTKQALKELDEEFETHRKIALEREQKVRRQLQDELNKQKKD
ncbi:tRNA (guanine-N1)-methyltransferase, partial [Lutibacter sp.]